MAKPNNNQIKTKPLKVVEEIQDEHAEARQSPERLLPQVEAEIPKKDVRDGVPANGPAPAAPKKKQFELSDTDFEILNQGQYSKAAWDYIGRRHSIDPDSRESLGDKQGRAFLAFPKKWAEEPPKQGGVLTTKNINAVSIHPSDIGSIRSSLHARDLTKPEAEAVATEQV